MLVTCLLAQILLSEQENCVLVNTKASKIDTLYTKLEAFNENDETLR